MQENNFHVNEHSLRTTISNVEPNKLTTRGFNQQDLIEKIRYGDMIYLILKGSVFTAFLNKKALDIIDWYEKDARRALSKTRYRNLSDIRKLEKNVEAKTEEKKLEQKTKQKWKTKQKQKMK